MRTPSARFVLLLSCGLSLQVFPLVPGAVLESGTELAANTHPVEETRSGDVKENVLDAEPNEPVEPSVSDTILEPSQAPGGHERRPHVHDGKAGCFGRRRVPPANNSDSEQAERLRAPPMRMRMRGRREARRPARAGMALRTESFARRADFATAGAAGRYGQLPARGKRDVMAADDNDVDGAPVESGLLDMSLSDIVRSIVKRCVNTILGGGSGKSGGSGAAVAIAREGIGLGRTAIDGGVQVARMVVMAFRELGQPTSLVSNMEASLPRFEAVNDVTTATKANVRSRRDVMTNVRKNLKNKADVVMSRTNDITENVNDRMDSVFGENPAYVKIKELVMTAIGKVVQGAVKASSAMSRRRRDADESKLRPPPGSTPPRPAKGKEAILARVIADLDNIPGRRVAKMVATSTAAPVTLTDSEKIGVKEMAGDEVDANGRPEGEAADMVSRNKRATSSENDSGDEAETTEDGSSIQNWSPEEAQQTESATSADPVASHSDIGAELGVRRRRDAVEGYRFKRDVMDDFRNLTERIMQRGKEVWEKAKQAFDDAMKRVQRSGAKSSPALDSEILAMNEPPRKEAAMFSGVSPEMAPTGLPESQLPEVSTAILPQDLPGNTKSGLLELDSAETTGTFREAPRSVVRRSVSRPGSFTDKLTSKNKREISHNHSSQWLSSSRANTVRASKLNVLDNRGEDKDDSLEFSSDSAESDQSFDFEATTAMSPRDTLPSLETSNIKPEEMEEALISERAEIPPHNAGAEKQGMGFRMKPKVREWKISPSRTP